MTNGKICSVVTACIGDRDSLRADQNTRNAQFIAFTDRGRGSSIWEERSACKLFASKRRNSRVPKILMHQFVDTEYSLWIDANVALIAPVNQLVGDWLKDSDIAMFKHHKRDCLFEEARVCAERRLDSPIIIREQMERYRAASFVEHYGLAETTVILRRHTRAVEKFNNYWWAEYCRYSVRDQISVMFAAKKAGIRIQLISPSKLRHPSFSIRNRPAGVEPL